MGPSWEIQRRKKVGRALLVKHSHQHLELKVLCAKFMEVKLIYANSIIESLVRYVLGITMMCYGLIKIFQIQFELPAEVLRISIEKSRRCYDHLAFLGFSSWFSVLLGIFELIPAFLLLFRKTVVLGAILLFPSLFVVFAINNAYDFLPHMRFFTGLLFALNLSLLFPRRKIFLDCFKNIAAQSPGTRTEAAINLLILCLLTFSILFFMR